MPSHKEHISFRLPQDLLRRIEAVRSQMAAHVAGIEVDRAKVVRLLLERGLASLEQEMNHP